MTVRIRPIKRGGSRLSPPRVLGALAALASFGRCASGLCAPRRTYQFEPGRPAFQHPSRVLTGYMQESQWALMELVFMAYSSWRWHFENYPSRFDLVVAGDPGMADFVKDFCAVVPEGVDPAGRRKPGQLQECFFFPYPDRSAEHYGFFGINQVVHARNRGRPASS
mmetsp:Transcript_13162/g.37063  ORF Transcript_13162/g.37063 Transcript_13162/m.37063 type:complete len:166 (+) Transcript_13162:164-661(+)